MKKIGTYDFETDPFLYGRIPEPFLACYHDENGTDYFWGDDCAERLLKRMAREKDRIIYAHNGGKFDIHYLLPLIKKLFPDQELPLMLIGSRVSSVKFADVELRDSINLFPVPLKAISKDEIEIDKLEREVRDDHRVEIMRYCKNDCVYLYKALERFQENYGQNLTLAGTAFKVWKKDFLDEPYPTLSENQDDRFRKYYFGGRTQAIETGEIVAPFKYVDICSAYPWAMLDEHPWGKNPLIKNSLKPSILKKSFVSVYATSYGALPLRAKDGSLSFPCDDTPRLFHVTGWEVLAGLRTGTLFVHDIEKQLYFPKTKNFKGYVNHFYKMKSEGKAQGDKFKTLTAKILLNALYGKMAQNPLNFKDHVLAAPHQMRELVREGWIGGEMTPSGQVFQRKSYRKDDRGQWETKPPRFYNVAVGASITGKVRAYLWESILQTERPVYCDTDSIICTGAGNLPMGLELGQWEVEGDNIERVAIAGKKLYATWRNGQAYKTGSKGARLSAEEIRQVTRGDVIQYNFDAPTFSATKEINFTSRKIRRLKCDENLRDYLRDRKRVII